MFRVNLFDLSESGPMKRFRPSSERFPEDAPSGPLDSAVHPRSTRAARSMPPSPRIRSQRSARNDLICNGSLLTYLPLCSQRSPETTRSLRSQRKTTSARARHRRPSCAELAWASFRPLRFVSIRQTASKGYGRADRTVNEPESAKRLQERLEKLDIALLLGYDMK